MVKRMDLKTIMMCSSMKRYIRHIYVVLVGTLLVVGCQKDGGTPQVMNNGFLGMVRQWQELFYDKRYSFTELVNPDFELLAKANHIAYRCVERHEDLDDAIREMHSTEGAFLLECRVEKEENVFPMVPAGAPVHDIRLE